MYSDINNLKIEIMSLLRKNTEMEDLPIALYKLDTPDRDGCICYVYYRSTAHYWTNLEDANKQFDSLINNRTISPFGKN